MNFDKDNINSIHLSKHISVKLIIRNIKYFNVGLRLLEYLSSL